MMDTLALALSTALAIFTAYYVHFLTRIRVGLSALQKQPRTPQRPLMTVLVAARNEEQTISACIEALCRQTYAGSLYEVIICDDGSTDGTVRLARNAFTAGVSFRILPAPPNARRGKTAALERGLAIARGSIIATTDADCLAPPAWLSTLAEYFTPDVAFVAGPVLEATPKDLFARIEQLEFLGVITAGAGLIGSGRPVICNGANMAFRRTAFDVAGGYGPPESANDDEGLMNRIVLSEAGRVAFAVGAGALVQTSSNNSLWSFLLQRARWAGKRGRYQDRSILVMLFAVYCFFLALFTSFVASFWLPLMLLPVALVIAGKAVIEFMLLKVSSRMFGTTIMLPSFLIAELFHVPYIVFTAAVGQFVPSRWKGAR